MLRLLPAVLVILAIAPTAGCQTRMGGMTLPSPHYLQHPPQYLPWKPPTASLKGGAYLATYPLHIEPVRYEQPGLLPVQYDVLTDPLMPKIPDTPKKRGWRERLSNLFSRSESAEVQPPEKVEAARSPVENPVAELPPQKSPSPLPAPLEPVPFAELPPQKNPSPLPAPLQPVPLIEYSAPKLTPPARNGTWIRQTEGMLTTLKIEANRIHLCIHSAYRDDGDTADTRYHVELVADAATGPDGRIFGVFTNVECQGLSRLPASERDNISKALNSVVDEPFSFRTRQDESTFTVSDVKGKMFQVLLVELNINGLQCIQGKYTSGSNKPLPEVKATPRKKEKPKSISSLSR